MTAHIPTAEQQRIIEAARTGENGKVVAGAGTGKTSTLLYLATDRPETRFLYLAYNKAIQVEAASKFPSNCECRTAHSMAYGVFGRRYSRRLKAKRVSARQAAALLSIQPFSYKMDGEDFTKSPRQVAVMVKGALSKFYNSADKEPSVYHFEYDSMTPGAEGRKSDPTFVRFTEFALTYLKAYWEDVQDINGQLNFDHDSYLKMWSLTTPQLPVDCVLFDEAQDANPCIAYVVQSQENCQTIMVGDSAQAIYGWRGAVDAMERFSGWCEYLTQSFRFGQPIADQANRWLNIVGTPLRLTGFDKITSTVNPLSAPDAVLCRTNAGCIESALLYQEQGLQVAITGGTKDIERFCWAANDLMQSKGTDHPDLGAYRDWSEVQEAVKNGEASDLGMLVRLVDNYGTHSIINVCRNSVKPEGNPSEWASQPGNIMVSTAHKAKGLEWNHVQIHGDFKPNKETGTVSRTEAMLIYVAITRAKLTLDNVNLSWLDDIEAELVAEGNNEDQA